MGSHVWSQFVPLCCVNNAAKKVECFLVWCWTDLVSEKDIKGYSVSFIFSSWNWFNAYTHAHEHTSPCAYRSTYTKRKKKKRCERKTTALSSKEPSQINFCLFPLMHLHHSLLTYSLPPLLSPLFPPVLALSTHEFSLFFSVWVYQANNFSFNEHVVFSCSAHSPNTPSQHWQLSGKGVGLCVCVCMRVAER